MFWFYQQGRGIVAWRPATTFWSWAPIRKGRKITTSNDQKLPLTSRRWHVSPECHILSKTR